jgi:hypothetical protein
VGLIAGCAWLLLLLQHLQAKLRERLLTAIDNAQGFGLQ